MITMPLKCFIITNISLICFLHYAIIVNMSPFIASASNWRFLLFSLVSVISNFLQFSGNVLDRLNLWKIHFLYIEKFPEALSQKIDLATLLRIFMFIIKLLKIVSIQFFISFLNVGFQNFQPIGISYTVYGSQTLRKQIMNIWMIQTTRDTSTQFLI